MDIVALICFSAKDGFGPPSDYEARRVVVAAGRVVAVEAEQAVVGVAAAAVVANPQRVDRTKEAYNEDAETRHP